MIVTFRFEDGSILRRRRLATRDNRLRQRDNQVARLVYDAILTESDVYGHAAEHCACDGEVVYMIDAARVVVADDNSWNTAGRIWFDLAIGGTKQIAKAFGGRVP
ncbi:MAG: hypothetical protein ACREPL_01840 [Rhodanobacteraceae bacterium]